MMRNTADKLPTPSRDSFILAGWRSAGVPEEDTVVLIAVEGYAAQSHAAQRGTLRLGVTFTQDDRVAVIRATAALHEQIAEQAKAHVASGAATRWGSESVTASLQWDWERPSPTQEAVQVRRFRAYAPVWVRFSDVAALAAWSLSLAELDGVSVEGITWTLTDDVSRTAPAREPMPTPRASTSAKLNSSRSTNRVFALAREAERSPATSAAVRPA